MAALPNAPSLVSVEEYLSTSYEPEVEFVDGVLVDRGMPTELHGIFQLLLGAYLLSFSEQFGFAVSSETRTEVVKRRRYRVPDIVVAPVPVEEGVITRVPWIIIEINSPGDRIGNMMTRFQDLESMGVRHVLWVDPIEKTLHCYRNGALRTEPAVIDLELPTGVLRFDLQSVFEQLDRSRGRA